MQGGRIPNENGTVRCDNGAAWTDDTPAHEKCEDFPGDALWQATHKLFRHAAISEPSTNEAGNKVWTAPFYFITSAADPKNMMNGRLGNPDKYERAEQIHLAEEESSIYDLDHIEAFTDLQDFLEYFCMTAPDEPDGDKDPMHRVAFGFGKGNSCLKAVYVPMLYGNMFRHDMENSAVRGMMAIEALKKINDVLAEAEPEVTTDKAATAATDLVGDDDINKAKEESKIKFPRLPSIKFRTVDWAIGFKVTQEAAVRAAAVEEGAEGPALVVGGGT